MHTGCAKFRELILSISPHTAMPPPRPSKREKRCPPKPWGRGCRAVAETVLEEEKFAEIHLQSWNQSRIKPIAGTMQIIMHAVFKLLPQTLPQKAKLEQQFTRNRDWLGGGGGMSLFVFSPKLSSLCASVCFLNKCQLWMWKTGFCFKIKHRPVPTMTLRWLRNECKSPLAAAISGLVNKQDFFLSLSPISTSLYICGQQDSKKWNVEAT